MGVPQAPAAPRPESMEGRKIALVWNHVFRGDEIFPVVEDALRERFGGVEFVGYDTFGSFMGGGEEEVLEALPGNQRNRRSHRRKYAAFAFTHGAASDPVNALLGRQVFDRLEKGNNPVDVIIGDGRIRR